MPSNSDHSNDNEISNKVEHTDTETQKEVLASYKILSFRSLAPIEYKSFVLSRWLHSLRFGNEMFRLTQSDSYYKAYSKYIDDILKRPMTRLRVAVISGDEDTALGFSVDENHILHYVYVKPEVRNLGIASFLVPKDIKSISHLTTIGMSIWNKSMPRVVFNPFV